MSKNITILARENFIKVKKGDFNKNIFFKKLNNLKPKNQSNFNFSKN